MTPPMITPDQIPTSLLNDSHFATIRNALDVIDVAFRHIAQAKQAGVKVDQYEKQLQEQRDQLLKLKNTYFPGR